MKKESVPLGVGSKHYGSKITEADVITIRSLYRTGEYTHRLLGEEYDLSYSLIGKIIRHERWKHVKETTDEN